MILSMTGFGEAARTEDGVHYHLEIRSVNNRYFKLTCKLAEQAAFLEAAIESRLRRDLGRGSIIVNLQVRNMSAEAAYEVNETALNSYLSHLRSLAPGGGQLNLTVDLATAILLPGVAQPRQDTEQRQGEIETTVMDLVGQASERLAAMRQAEGKAIQADLSEQLGRMSEQLDIVAARAPGVVKEYQQRLTERVNELLADQKIRLEAEMLAREVALFADRSDIHEEIQRLRTHIEQFRMAMAEPPGRGEPPQVGRKLDFLSQEFLREANTIGSKSSDAIISRACVEIKSAVDRVKEQVQNVV